MTYIYASTVYHICRCRYITIGLTMLKDDGDNEIEEAKLSIEAWNWQSIANTICDFDFWWLLLLLWFWRWFNYTCFMCQIADADHFQLCAQRTRTTTHTHTHKIYLFLFYLFSILFIIIWYEWKHTRYPSVSVESVIINLALYVCVMFVFSACARLFTVNKIVDVRSHHGIRH